MDPYRHPNGSHGPRKPRPPKQPDGKSDSVPLFRVWGADDVVYGPVELPTLLEWIQAERIVRDTWIYTDALAKWQKAEKHPLLKECFKTYTLGAPSSPDTPHPSKQADQVPTFKLWGADGVIYGPVELLTLLEWIQDERVGKDTFIYTDTLDKWYKAGQHPMLKKYFK